MATTHRPSWRLDGRDAVAVQVLLLLLALAYPVTVLVPVIARWVRGQALVWPGTVGEQTGPAVAGLGGPGVGVTYTDDVLWTIEHASTVQWLAALAPSVLTWAFLLAGCVLAVRLVRRTLAGAPFGPAGVRGLRALALLVAGYGIFVPAARLFAQMVVLFPVDPTGSVAIVLDASTSALPLVVGLLVLVVAESYAIGQRLADDVAGLV